MENQEYTMYEIITMSLWKACEVLCYEIKKQYPDMELIENILKHSNIDVNLKDKYGWTALMEASYNGHTEIVKLLLERPEIDVNLQADEDGWFALMCASRMDHTEIFQLLLERPEIRVNLQNKWGETAIMDASYEGHIEIVRMLLERPEINVNLKDEDGLTALMMASRMGRTEIVRLLREHSK